MSVLEVTDGLARTDETFRLSATVHLLLQRCSIMSHSFRADVVNYMKQMLERLANFRRAVACQSAVLTSGLSSASCST